MNIYETDLHGVYEIQNDKFNDQRGSFVKTYNYDSFSSYHIATDFKESFYSTSKKNVLRGMHFQLPPYDHEKLVYVTYGEIIDVAVDIRPNSKTFGNFYSTKLSQKNAKSLYLSKGFAHGFLTLSENATVVYMTSSVYSPNYDSGIRWDSFLFNWNITDPILSIRDQNFPKLENLR